MSTSSYRRDGPFLEQWIDGATVQSAWPERPGHDAIASGFAWQLNETCLVLFESIINELSKLQNPSVPDIISLKECLCRLYLWGEGFGGRRLDGVLQNSITLKEPVLEFLAAIAVILLQQLLPFIDASRRTGNILELTEELTDLVDKTQSTTHDAFNSSSEDEYNEFDSDDESEAVQKLDDTQGDIVEDINSYVSCLMSLLPSMELVLNFQDKKDRSMYLPRMNVQDLRHGRENHGAGPKQFKDYYSNSRVLYRADAHAESKKIKVTHRDGTTTYEYRAGRPEERALSSREVYDYYMSSERQEQRNRDKKDKSRR